MLNLLINGCFGKLGQAVVELAETQEDVQILVGVDPSESRCPPSFSVFQSLGAVDVLRPDVLFDCSLPRALPELLEFALRGPEIVPLVIATTGYGDQEMELLEEFSKKVPIFYSGNMSLGIHLLKDLAKKAAHVLGDFFDIEIIEAHHNQKVDAPSGTALILAEAVNSGLEEPRGYAYARNLQREPRKKEEIGIHSIRGGTIIGEHSVVFAGFDEVVELTHKAGSKRIFAAGCLAAARFMKDKKPGYYQMNDLFL